jgi:hypothetical protein
MGDKTCFGGLDELPQGKVNLVDLFCKICLCVCGANVRSPDVDML